MKIGIVGAGRMGGGLGRLWAKHGHHVMFSYSRRPDRLGHLVKEIGSHSESGTPQEAANFGDILLLAVPWSSVADALSASGPLDNKIVLSCVNPNGPLDLEMGRVTSAAEEISLLVPGAIVVEAFNTIFATLLPSRGHLFGNDTPTVFYCGDDRKAKDRVAGLIADSHFHAVDTGPLRTARYIENAALLMMELAGSQRLGSDIAIRLMNPAGPSELVKSGEVLARSFVAICAGSGHTTEDERALAEDFVAHLPHPRSTVRGRVIFEREMREFRSAFAHFECDIDEVIEDGTHVAVRWTWRGTHVGRFLDIPPTYRRVILSETHVLRIAGGRIVEDHVSSNLLNLLHQFGVKAFEAA